jgi:Bacterial pre-peptidase C-terminal domain
MRHNLALVAGLAVLIVAADPKKPEDNTPKVVVAAPLGLAPGKTTKLLVRGLKLDTTTEVRLHDPKGTAKILSKGKAPLPNKEKDDVGRYGDTQIEIEAVLSADYAGPTATFTVVTPSGESAPHTLFVDHAPIVAEKKPNNSFQKAQPVQLGQTIEGVVNAGSDVDVFRFDGKQGQQVVLEVFAARFGSPLDSLLTLYDADGRIVASNDDVDGTADSRVEATLPRTGVYYVSVVDANDVGSPSNIYRLVTRAK